MINSAFLFYILYRLWRSLSSFLHFVRYAEDIAISSNYQQSTNSSDFQIIELHKFKGLNIADASHCSTDDMMNNTKLEESKLLFRHNTM